MSITKKWLEITADEAAEILSAKVTVRESGQGTRLFVDVEKDGHTATIVPGEMKKEITDANDLADALETELGSRERSRAYVRGEVEAEEFDGYTPPEIEEEMDR